MEWTDSLAKEKAFLRRVVAWSAGNKSTGRDVVVAKYCGSNGNCSTGLGGTLQ